MHRYNSNISSDWYVQIIIMFSRTTCCRYSLDNPLAATPLSLLFLKLIHWSHLASIYLRYLSLISTLLFFLPAFYHSLAILSNKLCIISHLNIIFLPCWQKHARLSHLCIYPKRILPVWLAIWNYRDEEYSLYWCFKAYETILELHF